MIKVKLITLLKTFTKKEMKKFGLFISSPYFNNERNFEPLFRILKKYHPDFPPEEFTSEKLYSHLFPGIKYNKKKASLDIRVLFSQMTKLVKYFMVYELLNNESGRYYLNSLIAGAFEHKNLLNYAFNSILKNSLLIDSNEKTDRYFFDRIETNLNLGTLLLKMGKSRQAAEYNNNTLLFAYAFMFHIITFYLNTGFVNKYNNNIDFKGFELVKTFINSFDVDLFNRECLDDKYETKNLLLCNYYIIKSRIDEQDMQSLFNAIELFFKMYDNIAQQTRWNYFVLIFNRLIGRLQLDRTYSIKANELFDFVLEKGLIDTRNEPIMKLNPYYNILRIKAYLLSPAEFKSFVDKYAEKVPTEYSNVVKNYSLSFYFFKTGLFDKCLECVSRNDELGTHAMISKYKLKFCSLYEIKYFEDARYALVSFERFMKRNKKINRHIMKENSEFILKAGKMLKYRLGNENLKELEQIALNKDYSIFGTWFNDKAKEIINDLKPSMVS